MTQAKVFSRGFAIQKHPAARAKIPLVPTTMFQYLVFYFGHVTGGSRGGDLRLKRDDRRISLTLTLSIPSLFGKENLASIVFGGVI